MPNTSVAQDKDVFILYDVQDEHPIKNNVCAHAWSEFSEVPFFLFSDK